MMKSETNLFSELDHSISMDKQTINHFIENQPPPTEVAEQQAEFFNRHGVNRPRLIQYDELTHIHTGNQLPRNARNEELDDLVERHGVEVLAYYVPFHHHRHPQDWGIYLRREGIVHVRQKLLQFALDDHYEEQLFGDDLEIPTRVAVKVLLLHELKHHAIEVACTRHEIQNRIIDKYDSYIRSKRQNQTEHNATEAICNSNILQYRYHLKTDFSFPGQAILPHQGPGSIDWTTYVTRFMDGQPEGYNDFRSFRHLDQFQLRQILRLEHGVVGNVERVLNRNLPIIMREFQNHSSLSTLKRLPVPIYLC